MEAILERLREIINYWTPDPTNVILVKLITALTARIISLNFTSWQPAELNATSIDFTYNYIIVGGGTAGLVLASLLSTKYEAKILLIEGGANAPFTTEIPYFLPSIQRTNYDWNYQTVPQNDSCLDYPNSTCHIPLGKMVGGSTLLKSMVYNTGTKRDWNRWENLGNKNWNWKTVFPYFTTFIKQQPLEQFATFVGECNDKLKPLRNLIYRAAKELQLDTFFDDINTIIGRIGYVISYGTLRHGKTHHPGKIFLAEAIKNGNIDILKQNIVTQIRINPETKIAEGVEFAADENEFNTKFVAATEEVILCAGAINNAKLLMLSGVGPKDHLRDIDIPLVHRLEGVGRNFHDHVQFPGIFHVIKRPEWPTEFDEVTALEQFVFRKQGPLTSIGISDIVGYIYAMPGERSDYPNIRINHFYVYRNNTQFFTKFSPKIRDRLQKLNGQYSMLVQIPTLLKPKSRGRILLKNADPFAAPLIDPQYLTHPDDVVAMVRAIKHAVAIGETKAFQKIKAELIELHDLKCPACVRKDTNCIWICLLKQFATSAGNPVGTTRMGKCAECESSVVDHCLRVHGIRRLRVADASIMPEIISADIYASNIMFAQRAAEFILNKRLCD